MGVTSLSKAVKEEAEDSGVKSGRTKSPDRAKAAVLDVVHDRRGQLPKRSAAISVRVKNECKGRNINSLPHMTIQTRVLIEILQALGDTSQWATCHNFIAQDLGAAGITKSRIDMGFRFERRDACRTLVWHREDADE